mgnify:CR=1 FL=1
MGSEMCIRDRLVLFRANRPMKQNLLIVAMLWAIGVAWGACFDALGIVFV